MELLRRPALAALTMACVLCALALAQTRTLRSPGKWLVTEKKNAIDDSITRIASLDAEQEISDDRGGARPALLLRMKEGRLEASIVARLQVGKSAMSIWDPVRVRFDDGAAEEQKWKSYREVLFVPAETLTRLRKASRLAVEFDLVYGERATAVFDLTGIDKAATLVENAKLAAVEN